MQPNYIDEIIRSKKTCYFVSPHYDDAAFSAGALARYLKIAGKNRIVVINVFTKAGPRPHTASAKAYLRQCGYSDAKQLYLDRSNEDKIALSSIADEVIDLGFTEALWRQRTNTISRLIARIVPEMGKIYPTYRFHITNGKIAAADAKTFVEIKLSLTKIVNDRDSIVLCPLALGRHVDHVITRKACDELFSGNIHWADYPYNVDEKNMVGISASPMFTFATGIKAKKALIAKYRTQYDAMFRDGLVQKPESYFR